MKSNIAPVPLGIICVSRLLAGPERAWPGGGSSTTTGLAVGVGATAALITRSAKVVAAAARAESAGMAVPRLIGDASFQAQPHYLMSDLVSELLW